MSQEEHTVVCAWRKAPDCAKHLGGPPVGSGAPVSHGLCVPCDALLRAEIAEDWADSVAEDRQCSECYGSGAGRSPDGQCRDCAGTGWRHDAAGWAHQGRRLRCRQSGGRVCKGSERAKGGLE